LVDGAVSATATPASGSTFPLGVTTVNVSAKDAAGNTRNGSFTVTVRDTTAPQLALPPNQIAEAASATGAVVNFAVSATDLVNGAVSAAATPASGSTFPLGVTTVNVSATDAAGNTRNGSFTVTVRDTTAPQLALPPNQIVEAASATGAVVNFAVSASDLVDGAVSATATPASGSTFPLGVTTVNVSAKDAAGNTATGQFNVIIFKLTTLLRDVVIRPATAIGSASISGSIIGGPPGASVVLQASSDLGKTDPWEDIGTISLDSNGNASFGPISDPQSRGLVRDFFRVRVQTTTPAGAGS
jgi:fluoride ion exporter CrcB/FEX